MKLYTKFCFLLSVIVLSGNVYAGSASVKISDLADSLIKGYTSKNVMPKTILAVFPFNCDEKLEKQHVGFAISEVMSHRFVSNSAFTVVERAELGKLLSEQKLQSSGVVDSETAAKLGRVLGASVMLIGNIQKVGSNYQVNARLVNVETSEVLASGYEELASSAFEEDARVYLSIVPDTQTLGVYLIYSYRNNPNKRDAVVEPDAGGSGTFTRKPLAFSSNLAGGGLLYRPARNIQVNAEITTSIKETKYSSAVYSDGRVLESKLKVTTGSFMVSYVGRYLERWGYWAGLGVQGIDISASFSDNKKENPSPGLFVKSGVEFKPQNRIGLGLNLKYDLSKMAVYSNLDNKVLEFNPLSLESTLTLYF